MTPLLPQLALPQIEVATPRYRCPGESYTIDRAVHLGRLAAFYPACRGCTHRHDTGQLSTATREQLAEVAHRDPAAATFHSEGISGVAGNQLSTAQVRTAALAMGIHLQNLAERQLADPSEPHVVLGGDGRAVTAELVAAASEGLRRAGCTAIEIGAATCGSVAAAITQLPASGGMLLGNPTGESHVAGLKFWGPGARPWSANGNLDAIASRVAAGAERPVRHYGGVVRKNLTADYLSTWRDLFHALRPLRMVLATASTPTAKELDDLLKTSACQIQPVRLPDAYKPAETAGRPAPRVPSKLPSSHSTASGWQAAHERRLTHLGRQIRHDEAHLGVWIDGDGDCLHVFDEQGRAISGQRLLTGIARAVLASRPDEGDKTVVLEDTAEPRTADLLSDGGATVVRSSPTRENMALVMSDSAALLGGGPSGRLWWSAALARQLSGGQFSHAVSGPPVADVLLSLGVLLNLLSQSDRPLSEVLDAA